MTTIAPTITASTKDEYHQQMEMVGMFASRIHVDFADGVFAPSTLLPPSEAWLPSGYEIDVHLMHQNPAEVIESVLVMKPNLVILHAESSGNILGLLREIKGCGVRAGIALLQNSQPEEYANEIEEAEHTLIFGGNLGYQGGGADLSMLGKIERIQQINPMSEIGWDGGVSDTNAPKITHAGVRVLNVGGFIHKADDPNKAYAILNSMTE